MCLGCLLIAKVSYGYHRLRQVALAFDSVQVADSRESVIEKLGKPNYHSGACLQDLSFSRGCAQELVYSDPLAPLLPEYYVVDLSAQGRVINADHLISP